MRTLLFSCILSLGVLSGCGGSVQPGSDESQQVTAVVTSLNDAAGAEDSFKELFVGGSAPENRGAYFSTAIELINVQVNGEEAQATVKISQGNAASEGGDGTKSEDVAAGEVTWKLKKEAGTWKLQDAPLP